MEGFEIHMKIDMQVAIPEVKVGRRGYPYAELRIGDSFFAPTTGVSVGYWKKKTGYGYITRKTTENGQAGVRVWRTA
jgi:hypothetical protein